MAKKHFLFIIRRLTVGGSQVNLLSMVTELSKRGYAIDILSDSGILVEHLPKNVVWHPFPFTTLRHPNLRFYTYVKSLVQEKNIDAIIPIDPILSIETQLSYVFHKKPIYSLITAQNVPICYPDNWPTIFVNEDVRNTYITKFSIQPTYYIKERLDTSRFRPANKKDKSVLHFSLVSRLDSIKETSIRTTLDFFCYLKNSHQNLTFHVYGNGNLLEELQEEYLEIQFHGEVLDIESRMQQSHVVFGMASTIIQAMATETLSVVVGDRGLIDVVKPENIDYFAEKHYNVHNKEGITYKVIQQEVFKALKDESLLQFYGNYIQANYAVSIGIDKLLQIINKKYYRGSYRRVLFSIFCYKFNALKKRFI